MSRRHEGSRRPQAAPASPCPAAAAAPRRRLDTVTDQEVAIKVIDLEDM